MGDAKKIQASFKKLHEKIKINSINLKLGYETIDLITPLEVIGSE